MLKWIVGRIEGEAEGIETPIGIVAKPEAIDVSGLDVATEDVAEALAFNPDEWRQEIPSIEELFEFIGPKLPSSLRDELEGLKQRLS